MAPRSDFDRPQNFAPKRNCGLYVVQAFVGQVFPRSRYGAFHDDLDRLRRIIDGIRVLPQGGLITLDDLLKNTGRRHAGKV